MTNITDLIIGNIGEYNVEYRVHATRRMFQRNIQEEDIQLLLRSGEVIERYDEDFPLPSVLVSRRTSSGRPLHAVVGINLEEKELIIITTYEPDPLKWAKDFSRRL